MRTRDGQGLWAAPRRRPPLRAPGPPLAEPRVPSHREEGLRLAQEGRARPRALHGREETCRAGPRAAPTPAAPQSLLPSSTWPGEEVPILRLGAGAGMLRTEIGGHVEGYSSRSHSSGGWAWVRGDGGKRRELQGEPAEGPWGPETATGEVEHRLATGLSEARDVATTFGAGGLDRSVGQCVFALGWAPN